MWKNINISESPEVYAFQIDKLLRVAVFAFCNAPSMLPGSDYLVPTSSSVFCFLGFLRHTWSKVAVFINASTEKYYFNTIVVLIIWQSFL